jgi:flotillin
LTRRSQDPADDGGVDHRLVGKIGKVTVTIRPPRLGEVIVGVRGGSEQFAASSDEVIAVGTRVVIVTEDRSRTVTVTEMEKLGIVVDGLQIQEIEDQAGYISNLAAPHSAAVASSARIAAARADQAAAQEEQMAAAAKAEFARDTEIKQAGFLAEVQEAKAKAAQAGPLAEARASQEVIQEQTAVAQKQVDLAAQKLEAEVRRPADAEAYRQRTLADASRDRVKAETEAEAFKQRGMAEANRDAVKFNTEAETGRRRAVADADAAATQATADGNAYAQRALAPPRPKPSMSGPTPSPARTRPVSPPTTSWTSCPN